MHAEHEQRVSAPSYSSLSLSFSLADCRQLRWSFEENPVKHENKEVGFYDFNLRIFLLWNFYDEKLLRLVCLACVLNNLDGVDAGSM